MPGEAKTMAVSSISAASLRQYVASSSNPSQLQQALQSLQKSLAVGDLTGAQSAFQTLQQVNQNLVTANGSASPGSSQISTDLTALGSALSSGDLSGAQSAFAAVQSDFKSAASPAQILEKSLALQSEQLVQGLLNTLNSTGESSSSAPDASSLLASAYGSGGLNVVA
jgi:hypothetical protein